MSAQDVDTATSETAVTAKRKFPGRKRKARKSAGPKVAARRRAASRARPALREPKPTFPEIREGEWRDSANHRNACPRASSAST